MRLRALSVLTVASTVLAGCSATDAGPPEKAVYVSLGDSLAVGIQPDSDGELAETSHGYPEELFRTLYAEDSTLEHVSLGCPGEDTTSMMDGTDSNCEYTEGSQLAEAEAVLAEHEGRVRLVTVGIGGNNFTGCVEIDVAEEDEDGVDDAGADDDAAGPEDPDAAEDAAEDDDNGIEVDEDCIDEGLDRLDREIVEISDRLRDAAGDDVQIIGMNYYNPFLAGLLLSGSAVEDEDGEDAAAEGGDEDADEESGTGDDLIDYATDVLEEVNDTLSSTFAAHNIDLADVAEDFDSYNFDVPAGSDDDTPANVQEICDYTWMCNVNVGPDIHTNDAGGRKIAEVFVGQVR